MKKIIYSLVFACLMQFAHAQQLVLHKDFPGITWPFLFDMEQDSQGNLYVCSQQGILYVKMNGVWQATDLDPNSNAYARGIAIDEANGVVWVSTENGLYSITNGTIEHFTAANSGLPADDLRDVRYHDGKLWISLFGNGLAVKEGDTFTHYNTANSALESDYIYDLAVTPDGTVIAAADEDVHFFKNGTWTHYDFNDLFGYDTWAQDIYVDHNEDVWFAAKEGVIKFNHATQQFENLKSVYGYKNYSAIIHTPDNKVWLGEIFEGLHYFDPIGNHYFFEGNLDGQPSQVFDFMYYNDTVRVIGNIGATVTGLTLIYPDADSDGFTAETDCNDSLATVNPNGVEVANNGIDEDCDGIDLISSIHEIAGLPLELYPNPSYDWLYVKYQGNQQALELKMYSVAGQLLLSQKGTNPLSLSSLHAGLYWLEISDTATHEYIREKIVVE